jgi:hypothetical protein
MSILVRRSMSARVDSGGPADGVGRANSARHCEIAAVPAAIGEQAEMADADEAVGDDVEQEATDELLDLEAHGIHAVPVCVVAPPEADAAVGEGDEALLEMATRWV